MTARFRALAAVLLSAPFAAACGVPLMTLPSGPGAPAADASAALTAATATCRTLTTITAELGVSGRLGGRKVRARLLAGLSSPASAYLDAPAPFGPSAFVFVANGDEATLLLPRDRRVLERGRADAILEAVTGIPLGPEDLRSTLTGCAPAVDAGGARALGDRWRVVPGRRELYLNRDRDADPWRLVAVVHRPPGQAGWRAEYRDFSGNLPRTIRLASTEAGRFDLQLTLSQVDINVTLDDATFRPQIPAGYAPVTLEEIRRTGPLADQSDEE